MFGGNLLGVVGFLMFATQLTPYVAVITLGLHATVVPAALYPCIPLLVSATNEGLGYAVMSSVINLLLVVMSPLAGLVLDDGGFYWLAVMMAGISLAAVFVSLLWNVKDLYSFKPILNEPDTLFVEMNELRSYV